MQTVNRGTAAIVIAISLVAGARAAPLPRLAIDGGSLTVSGVSSGGYMATQFQLSFSRVVGGIGVFAAGPWGCARDSLVRALADCLDRPTSAPDVPALVELARTAAAAGTIDPLEGLAATRVWLFHGTRDELVAPPVAAALAEFYRSFVAPPNLRVVDTFAAPHGVPTEAAGASCDRTAPPYLYACRYDGVGEMLTFLYRGAATATHSPPGLLTRFDQARYDPQGTLAAQGYLYVPRGCDRHAPCRLHIAFHGCRQGTEFVGEAYVRDAGYNRWADSNRLIVLYPQAQKSLVWPLNPQGCWDWWGYAGADYATHNGPQVAAVRAMVRALAGF